MSITGFSGIFNINNWTLTPNGGTIDTTNTPSELILYNADNGAGEQNTTVLITSPLSGNVSFDWNVRNVNSSYNLYWDPFIFIINNTNITLTNDSAFSGSGSFNYNINVGDSFGFNAKSLDSLYGYFENKIFNFIFIPTPTPTLGTFTVGSKTFGDSPFTITPPTSNSSGAFSYNSSNTSVATISGNIITIVGAGNSIITANQAATTNYNAASTNTTFTVSKANPTLGPFTVGPKTFGDSPFTITPPTSNSPGAFSYTSSNTSVATISGNTITIVGAGSSVITANQAATNNYNSASTSTTFTVSKANPTLGPFSVPSKTFGDSPFTITPPTSNSPGAFSYTSSNSYVATISGNTITIVGAGSSIITANQAATNNYNSATTNTTFYALDVPNLGPFSVPLEVFGNAPFTITPPTSNSPGTFSYTSSNTSVAIVNGNIITIVGAGNSIITAYQAPSGIYGPASTNTTLYVSPANPTLTNFSIPEKVYTDPPFPITPPTSNSSGSFSYTSSNTAVATIAGNIITINGTGKSNITANQAASGNYGPGSINALFISNICFVAGTLIKTDQGAIAIEKINPEIHTINNEKIIGITQTVTTNDCLICIEKHALGNNIPSQKTKITEQHKISYHGKMVEAKELIKFEENVYKIKYKGEILYNVLMEKHNTMLANNLLCETLDPESFIAKLYISSKQFTPEQQVEIAKQYNHLAVKENKFTQKQMKNFKCAL